MVNTVERKTYYTDMSKENKMIKEMHCNNLHTCDKLGYFGARRPGGFFILFRAGVNGTDVNSQHLHQSPAQRICSLFQSLSSVPYSVLSPPFYAN